MSRRTRSDAETQTFRSHVLAGTDHDGASVTPFVHGTEADVTPRDAARLTECTPAVLTRPGDWFSGYSVLGVSFASGHVLALRRFAASSIGPGYGSVWHRTATGVWTFYASVRPDQACARYFGAAVDANVIVSVEVEWVTPHELCVSIAHTLDWRVTLRSSFATRFVGTLAGVWPDRGRRSSAVRRGLEWMAEMALGTGTVRLTGLTPNRNPYEVIPSYVCLVASSRAVWRGHDLGPYSLLTSPVSLGDVRIPRRGVFVVGEQWFDQPAPRTDRPVRFGRPCSEVIEGCAERQSTEESSRGGVRT
jgi:hypothetical protein